MLKEVLNQLVEKESISSYRVMEAFKELLIMQQPELIAAFLVSLRSKGETIEEIAGIVRFMRSEMVRVNLPGRVMDIVGTGGDQAQTINLSTAAAIVTASGGVKIAKHGNRSVSSLSGSADVVQALGIPLLNDPKHIQRCVQEAGIGFLFAPYFHPAMKVFSEVRRSLKIRTVFNTVGPLLNPAEANVLMIGVYHRELVAKLAAVLQQLGTGTAIVFHGQGLDELSCVGPADYFYIDGQDVKNGKIDPENYGLKRCSVDDLKGGNPEENAKRLINIFQGEKGPMADSIALNAGVAFFLYGIAKSMEEGVQMAKELLNRGKPYEKLMQWREVCRAF